MNDFKEKIKEFIEAIEIIKNNFLNSLKEKNSSIHIYTHLDADGLSSGAILGKALFRENIPFQITVLRQLEKEEITKISENTKKFKNFLIFSDFGSGQYIELQNQLISKENFNSFIILDHHLPQNVSSKEDIDLIKEIHKNSFQWHINPYFFRVDGSLEISGAGLCYFFAKSLNQKNIDLSPIALVGAVGDIQNQGPNKSFLGINSLILEDAKSLELIEIKNDLNFSSIKPLNEAIAYSKEIILPGLTGDVNRTLIFLQTLGILMENSNGNIRTLNDINQDEKQKITTAIIEYISTKLDVEPREIIEKLIINRYLLKNELSGSEFHDLTEFSNLLNACGRTNSASLGIAIAMGDRKKAYQKSQEVQINYKKSLMKSLTWIQDNQKIQHMEYIQYFFGEDIIPENIIGTIASMLVFENFEGFDKSKPIFGLAKRKDENVYKVSGRAHKKIVSKGVNLSQAIREACKLSKLDVLGGGHPPAAGTKIPIDKSDVFLENCNIVIRNQLKNK
ncbi:MAG: DHH family phosphoesterase [Candidatus Lokiarchaeota archaeon]|nr:DHH family phosphoesterase [Candidatus Lokiarchaeota archaeon]